MGVGAQDSVTLATDIHIRLEHHLLLLGVLTNKKKKIIWKYV